VIATVAPGIPQLVDRVPWNGKRISYAVVAVRGGKRSAAGRAATRVQGVPDAPTWQAAEATGLDGAGRFSFSAGELRGSAGTYRLTTSAGTYTGSIARGGQVSGLVAPAGSNGSPVTPTVQICNAQELCSAGVAGPALTPYGPLSTGSITALTTSITGTSATFTTTVDSNGRPAAVTVTGSRGYSRTWNVDSRSSTLTDSHAIGYFVNETFTVTVASPGRGSGTKSGTSPTTPPAPVVAGPTLIVSKGPQHTVSGCSSAACSYVRTTTKDFGGNVTCHANSSIGAGGFVTWTQGPNATRDGPNVFGVPGGWVDVTCSDGSSTRTTRTTW
jgi:hypothetical protein